MNAYQKLNSVIQLPIFSFGRSTQFIVEWDEDGIDFGVYTDKALTGKAFDVYSACCLLIEKQEVTASDICEALNLPAVGKYSADVRKQMRLISETEYRFKNCLVPGATIRTTLLDIEEIKHGRKIAFRVSHPKVIQQQMSNNKYQVLDWDDFTTLRTPIARRWHEFLVKRVGMYGADGFFIKHEKTIRWLPCLTDFFHKSMTTIGRVYEELKLVGWDCDMGTRISNIPQRIRKEQSKNGLSSDIHNDSGNNLGSTDRVACTGNNRRRYTPHYDDRGDTPMPEVTSENAAAFDSIFVGDVHIKEDVAAHTGNVDYQEAVRYLVNQMGGSVNSVSEERWFSDNITVEKMNRYFPRWKTWWEAALKTGADKLVIKSSRAAFIKHCFREEATSYFETAKAEQESAKMEQQHQQRRDETQCDIKKAEQEKAEQEKNDQLLYERMNEKIAGMDCKKIAYDADSATKEDGKPEILRRAEIKVFIWNAIKEKLNIPDGLSFSVPAVKDVTTMVVRHAMAKES